MLSPIPPSTSSCAPYGNSRNHDSAFSCGRLGSTHHVTDHPGSTHHVTGLRDMGRAVYTCQAGIACMWVPFGWQCRWLHRQGWSESGPVWCLRVVQQNVWHVTHGVPGKSQRCTHGATRDSVLLSCSGPLPFHCAGAPADGVFFAEGSRSLGRGRGRQFMVLNNHPAPAGVCGALLCFSG